MPLIIAHGLPKSGSTFLYQVAKEAVAAGNGLEHYAAKEKFFPGMEVPDYVPNPTDDVIAPILATLPPNASYVLKTHGKITPSLKAQLAAGKIKAFLSFRDPRDALVSMLDAGARDRAENPDRFFAKLKKVDDAIRPVEHDWLRIRDWARCPQVLKIPYYLIAAEQDFVVDRLCRFLGAQSAAATIAARYAADKAGKITEFNQGVADRFLSQLSRADLLKLSDKLKGTIREVDALTARCMAESGFRLLYQNLHQRRQARLLALR
jgi:hypothetical protein